MTTFQIVKYKGHSNHLTSFGKEYLALPDQTDPLKHVLYGLVSGKLDYNGLCSEDNRFLEVTGEFKIDFIEERNNKLKVV
jgi:hypothetical protein